MNDPTMHFSFFFLLKYSEVSDEEFKSLLPIALGGAVSD